MPGKAELSATLFYNHLDSCEQCRNNPFNLCDMGQTLLTAAAITHAGPDHLNTELQEIHARRRQKSES
jgi:predicted anti-sigma-YlaC factor YlaD